MAKIKLTFYALQGIKRVKSKSRTAALGGSREGGYSQKEVHQIQSSLHQSPSLRARYGTGCTWRRRVWLGKGRRRRREPLSGESPSSLVQQSSYRWPMITA